MAFMFDQNVSGKSGDFLEKSGGREIPGKRQKIGRSPDKSGDMESLPDSAGQHLSSLYSKDKYQQEGDRTTTPGTTTMGTITLGTTTPLGNYPPAVATIPP